jgi:hypothetical protein
VSSRTNACPIRSRVSANKANRSGSVTGKCFRNRAGLEYWGPLPCYGNTEARFVMELPTGARDVPRDPFSFQES